MATTTRRPWLRPPQLRTLDDQGERHATWLELFFDLVFVISIAEVVHTLEDYRSAEFQSFLGGIEAEGGQPLGAKLVGVADGGERGLGAVGVVALGGEAREAQDRGAVGRVAHAGEGE